MESFDIRKRAVFRIIEALSENQDLCCMSARNDDDTVLIGNDDVPGIHLDSSGLNGHVLAGKPIMRDRG